MRIKSVLVMVATAIGLIVTATAPVSAFGWDRPDQRANWGAERDGRHSGYDRRDRHAYADHGFADPDTYRYEPRGYYPYYNSEYWGAPRVRRFRGQLPPYYGSWGAPVRNYRHVEWHRRHYGGHRRGDW